MRTIFGPIPVSPTFWTASVRLDTQLLTGVGWRDIDYGYLFEVRPLPGVVVQLSRPTGRIHFPMPATPQPYDLPKMREPGTTKAPMGV